MLTARFSSVGKTVIARVISKLSVDACKERAPKNKFCVPVAKRFTSSSLTSSYVRNDCRVFTELIVSKLRVTESKPPSKTPSDSLGSLGLRACAKLRAAVGCLIKHLTVCIPTVSDFIVSELV